MIETLAVSPTPGIRRRHSGSDTPVTLTPEPTARLRLRHRSLPTLGITPTGTVGDRADDASANQYVNADASAYGWDHAELSNTVPTPNSTPIPTATALPEPTQVPTSSFTATAISTPTLTAEVGLQTDVAPVMCSSGAERRSS